LSDHPTAVEKIDTCPECNPCAGCNPTLLPDGSDPCDICDPCSASQKCAYCGNGFCRCDPVTDTEDGPMHIDCAKKVT